MVNPCTAPRVSEKLTLYACTARAMVSTARSWRRAPVAAAQRGRARVVGGRDYPGAKKNIMIRSGSSIGLRSVAYDLYRHTLIHRERLGQQLTHVAPRATFPPPS